MTLLDLDVPFADTRAASLRWARDAAPRSCLAHRAFALAPGTVDVRILGASHQVVVRRRDGTCLGEVVACDVDGEALPRSAGDGTYAIDTDVVPLSPAALDAARRDLASAAHVLAGTFPGVPGAMTAIVVGETGDGITWRTWHAYPQSGELVLTRSTVASP